MGDKLQELLADLCSYETEREWFEFKENWFDQTQLGQYISALSNSAAIEGRKNAYFIWGINNTTHEITGTTFNCNMDIKNEPLKHFLVRQISPDINFTFDELNYNERKIVILTIPAAKIIPTSFNNERFIRIGSSKESLRKYPEKESFLFDVLRHGFPTIENTPSKYQNLTFEKLFIYYGAKGLKLNPDTFKVNLNLLTENGKYNILAQLLSDNSQLPLRVAIFSGKSKADKLYSIRDFGYQCILYTLEDVLHYGDVLNLIQADETGRIVDRKDISLFENKAFREAIINAFVHNKWTSENEPMITVFSDRIEILSRGVLAPEQTIEGFFRGESIPVNKKLSEIFLQLHISEKTGRGVPVIVNTYGKDAFEFHENSIVVKIPFKWINEQNLRPKRPANLNETQSKVLREIKNNPNITKPELAKLVGLSKTSIDNAISALKEKKLLTHIGANKNGHWDVLEVTENGAIVEVLARRQNEQGFDY